MEGDGLCLHLAVFDVHLVATQNNGDVGADTEHISMPVGNILVCHSGCDVEHDDGTLSLDAEWIVSIMI